MDKVFIEMQKEIYKPFEKKDYEKVHKVIEKVQAEFPDRLDKTAFWKACVYAVEGKREFAISVLQGAINQGIWWNPFILTNDPDLQSLQEHKSFQTIIEKCRESFDKQQLASEAKLFTEGNHNANIGIFSIHWRGSNSRDFSPFSVNENIIECFFGFP